MSLPSRLPLPTNHVRLHIQSSKRKQSPPAPHRLVLLRSPCSSLFAATTLPQSTQCKRVLVRERKTVDSTSSGWNVESSAALSTVRRSFPTENPAVAKGLRLAYGYALGRSSDCHFDLDIEVPSLHRKVNPLVGLARPISIATDPRNFIWDYGATIRDTMVRSERGEEVKDEIVQEIANELRLIREELQNLTMAVRAVSANGNKTSYQGKSRNFDPRRAPSQTDSSHHQRGQKPQRNPQSGEPRSQWHQNAPKDKI